MPASLDTLPGFALAVRLALPPACALARVGSPAAIPAPAFAVFGEISATGRRVASLMIQLNNVLHMVERVSQGRQRRSSGSRVCYPKLGTNSAK